MRTVLLIEDNPQILDNTSELLQLEGYKVVLAENGNKGIELAKTIVPDIILCDILMPETNGYEVLEELKQNHITAGIPFIFITASVENAEMEKGMNMGATEYIRKPYDPAELIDTIIRILQSW